MAVPTTTDPLRDALDAIMDWPDEGETPIAGGGLAAPREDVVNLATTATLQNEVPPPVEDPFAAELAALQASNAELAAQLAAPAPTTQTTQTTAAAKPAQPTVLYTADVYSPMWDAWKSFKPSSGIRPEPTWVGPTFQDQENFWKNYDPQAQFK